MLTQIRHIQKGTLIVVTVIIVIAFAMWGDFSADSPVGGQNCVVKVYDRCYRAKEARVLSSHYDVAFRLGMYDFATVLFGENRRDDDRTDFILSLIILRKEAQKLGIEPTAEEIKEAIPTLPIFMQPYVDARYVENNILGPNGFTDGDLAQLVKDYLSYQKLRELVGAGSLAVPTETDKVYTKRNQRYHGSIIDFDRAKFAEGLEVTDDEVKEYFESNQDTLMSEPLRGFEYVKFVPTALPEDATNEQRSKAVLEFQNAVNRAYSKLADDEVDFMTAAKELGKTEGEKPFTLESGVFEPFSLPEPPEMLAGDAEMVTALFSGALQIDDVTVPFRTGEDGYFVLHYTELVEPRPLGLEEATPAIREALVAKNSNRLVNDAANEVRARLNEALESGKTFADAAKAAEVDLQPLPAFSQVEPPAEIADPGLVIAAAQETPEGGISRVMERPDGKGFFLLYVEKTDIYEDEDEESAKRSISASTEAAIRRTLFTSWLNQRRLESGAMRDPYGAAESGGPPVEELPDPEADPS